MTYAVKNALALSLAACPGLFFVNPPFWTLLLTDADGPPIAPQVQAVAKLTRSILEASLLDTSGGQAPTQRLAEPMQAANDDHRSVEAKGAESRLVAEQALNKAA